MLPSSFKLAAALQLWLGYLRLGEAAAIEKRLVTTDTSDFTLYAYGTNISGLPVFFGDCKSLHFITDCFTHMWLTSLVG